MTCTGWEGTHNREYTHHQSGFAHTQGSSSAFAHPHIPHTTPLSLAIGNHAPRHATSGQAGSPKTQCEEFQHAELVQSPLSHSNEDPLPAWNSQHQHQHVCLLARPKTNQNKQKGHTHIVDQRILLGRGLVESTCHAGHESNFFLQQRCPRYLCLSASNLSCQPGFARWVHPPPLQGT